MKTAVEPNVCVTFDGRVVDRGSLPPLAHPTRSLDSAIKIWEETTGAPWTDGKIAAAKKAASVDNISELKNIFGALTVDDPYFEPSLLGAFWNPKFMENKFQARNFMVNNTVLQNVAAGAPLSSAALKNLARTLDLGYWVAAKRLDRLESTVQHEIVDSDDAPYRAVQALALREDLCIGLQLKLYRHVNYDVRSNLAENVYLDGWVYTQLAKDLDYRIRGTVAKQRWLPTAMWMLLAADDAPYVRRMLIQNVNAPEEAKVVAGLINLN